MGFGNFIFFIVILVVAINAIKRAMEKAGDEAKKNAPQGRDFEAGPSEVEEFLRSLQQARRQQTQVQVQRGGPPAQAGRAPAQARAPQARPAEGMRPRAQASAEVPFWLDQERGAVRTVKAAAPAARPVRVHRPAKQDVDDHVETLVAKEPVKEEPAPKPKAAVVTPPELKKVSLKDAVIWSEILGPPLSRRGPRSGRMGR